MTLHLIQTFLPLDREGRRFPDRLYRDLKQRLVEAFGGVTVYARAPAEGLWADDGSLERDEIVIYEVMAPLDRAWWRALREELERDFQQKEVMIRAHGVEQL